MFVEPPNKKLFCRLCDRVFSNPVIVECGVSGHSASGWVCVHACVHACVCVRLYIVCVDVGITGELFIKWMVTKAWCVIDQSICSCTSN